MSSPAIKVEGVSKLYRIGRRERYRTLRDTLSESFRFSFGKRSSSTPEVEAEQQLWALNDVSFEIAPGEVLGVVGGNGAGKSTLLKILSRITEPTCGSIEIHGRVGSLLEVGTGFHPELTGRENIFLNGAILGMRRAEIERQFDAIVDFAEVDRFIDTPVKRYSSGMYMRLAFAVAAHLNPEILLIDEVLAVGDTAFQKKCLSRMNDVAQEGRTILFVSHNLIAVESLCSRVLLLDKGKVKGVGPPREIINKYLRQNESGRTTSLATKHRNGTGEIRFSTIELFLSRGGSPSRDSIRAGDDFQIRLGFTASSRVPRPTFSVSIFNSMSVPVFSIHTVDLNFDIDQIESDGMVTLHINRPNLMPGRYLIHIAAGDSFAPLRYDHIVDAAELDIEGADVFNSGRISAVSWTLVFFNCQWDLSLVPSVGLPMTDLVESKQ